MRLSLPHVRNRMLGWMGLGCLAIGAPTEVFARSQQVVRETPGRNDSAAMQTLLARRISVRLDRVTLNQAIQAAAGAADVRVMFREDIVKRYRQLVTLNLSNVPLGTAFERILAGTNLQVAFGSTTTLVLREGAARVRSTADTSAAQSRAAGAINGRVIDSATQKALAGAMVAIEGTKLVARTSEQGMYTLKSIPQGDHVLTVKLVGYRTVKRSITIANEDPLTVNVSLVGNATVLSGVVTTATGLQRRLEVGNDITMINVDSIMAIAPIMSLTDLLETRVPGMIVQRTSGTPGAPSRLRLRGTSSLTRSSDPIVIVDGVRVSAGQSSVIKGKPVSNDLGTEIIAGRDPLAPSPFDQIDPNSIATIEVFKGPSASAMYGADAGNGVIVITTKRGQGGRTRWTLVADGGQSMLPDGGYPTNFYRFGHSPQAESDQISFLCRSSYTGNKYGEGGCATDSVIEYQALNSSRLSPFGHGTNSGISMSVSGGNTITYLVAGSASNEQGILRLPRWEVDRFTASHGFGPPDWMRRPEQFSRWGGNSNVNIGLGTNKGSLALVMSLLRTRQQSGGAGTIASLQGGYVDTLATYIKLTDPLVPSFYTRTVNQAWTTTTGATLQYPLLSWLPVTATAGVNLGNLERTAVTPRGYLLVGSSYFINEGEPDSIGRYEFGQGTTMEQTLSVGTVLQLSSRRHLPGVRIPLGFNLITQSEGSFRATAVGLPTGVMEPISFPSGANNLPTRSRIASSTYGWYVAPMIDLHSRVFVNPGIRFDGGSASGSNAGFSPFPKLDISWLAFDRPNDPLWGALTLLRPRIAFGIAGVQPEPADQLRLFEPQTGIFGNGTVPEDLLSILNIGNTRLRPERSREVEGGLEAELWNQRITLKLTGYHKLRHDAILRVPVAPSIGAVDGMSGSDISYYYMVNVGDIRNTGMEATLGAGIIDRASVRWSVETRVHRNSNILQRLAPGVPGVGGNISGVGTRLVPGYPVFGMWERPVAGYADADGNGFITPGEVRIADSAIFLGAQEPNYELTASTSLSLFNGRVSLSTDIDYQSGLTQNNLGATQNVCAGVLVSCVGRFASLANDPRTSLGLQALIAASAPIMGSPNGRQPPTNYGLIQTVNMLRWQSLSINVQVPPTAVRRFGIGSMAVALRGRNLALRTNYRGKDPNVNSLGAAGNAVSDAGAVPLPRVWSLQIRVGN